MYTDVSYRHAQIASIQPPQKLHLMIQTTIKTQPKTSQITQKYFTQKPQQLYPYQHANISSTQTIK